jgi:uroporphyrin-III C-methyltransferase
MNDPQADETTGLPEDRPEAKPRASEGRSMGVVVGFLALLISVAAIGGVAFTWWQMAEQLDATAGQRAEATGELAAMRELVATTQERLAVQEEHVRALNGEAEARRRELAGMDVELNQARARLDALVTEERSPAHSPTIAELEFLLLLAGRELALADNPRVALAALREADQRVARMEDPGLAGVRAAISDEIAAVEAVADTDLEGIALRLASLARRVEGLPLRASLAPDPPGPAQPPAEATGWDRLRERMRAVGSNMFRIRRTDTPAAPLLSPDESFFLYRNVELDLKSARLAALSRDPVNYSASLESARRALESYFEAGDDAVQSLIEAIQALEQHDIAPQWPDISRSLGMLRAAEARD